MSEIIDPNDGTDHAISEVADTDELDEASVVAHLGEIAAQTIFTPERQVKRVIVLAAMPFHFGIKHIHIEWT